MDIEASDTASNHPLRAQTGERSFDARVRAPASPAERATDVAQIAWLEILETGVAELDAWHRQLVNDCNHLLALTSDRGPWLQIVAAAALLSARLRDHFRFEEEVMERNDFPRRAAHVAEHRKIEDQLVPLLSSIKAEDGSRDEHYSMPTVFKAILLDLMVRHDLDYRSHLLHRLGR